MGEILAILGIYLALEIIFLGILTAWWQFFPASVEQARVRVERTPWKCFWLGCVAFFILLPPVAILLFLPLNITRIAGCFLLMVVLALSGLGAAGLAAKTGGTKSHVTSPVRRNVVLELAAALWMGGVATVILLPPVTILLDLPLKQAWLIGCSLVFTTLLIVGLGTAVRMGKRVTSSTSFVNDDTQPVHSFLRGTAIIGLAAGFPVIGWFIAFPITLLMSLGAMVFALFRWAPAAETMERKEMKIRNALIPVLVTLWILPPMAISVAAVAFFVRGGIPIELAAEFPFIGWCIVLPIYIILVVGGTITALLRRRRRRTAQLASGSI
jgi:hypothetical protein